MHAPQASDEMTASARPHALGSFLATAPLIALSQQGLLMQNRAQQRIVDLDVPIIADEAQPAKLVHEIANAGSRGPDHLCQCFLTNVRADRLRAAFLAEIGEQQQQSSKPPLARIEELVDQVLLNPTVPGQEIRHEEL